MTPASSGYFMPAEWEQHESTWLQWPNNGVEPGYELKQERTWLEMVAVLIATVNCQSSILISRMGRPLLFSA